MEFRRVLFRTVGQVLPDSADALHLGLTAELTFGTYFARHASHFRSETVELIHHGVDGVLQLQNLTPRVHGDLSREVAFGHRGSDAGDVAHLVGEIDRHGVDAL